MERTNSKKFKDLAKVHGPITNFFPQPAGPEEWTRHALSKEQIAFF